ncbi:MAG: response regulator [Phycisphaerales bacterium]|nr:response regulator [Phycisphaerales bacterium]
MMSAPMPENEAERLAALRAYEVLDTPPEESFDRITRFATQIFNVPTAVISLVDSDREWFKSACGTASTHGDRTNSFCGHAILANDVFVVEDALQDDRFADNPAVMGESIRFYAGAPLCTAQGANIGVLCLRSPHPRRFSERDREMLNALAASTMTELDLRVSKARAEAACRARTRFFANLGHEIRTPMTAIIGFTDLLTHDELSGAQRQEALRTIKRNSEQLLGILSDVLDLSRLESGRIDLHWNNVRMNNIFDDLRSMFEWRAKEKDIELRIDVARNVPLVLRTDSTRLMQILINLVSNAIRYTKEGAVDVLVSYAEPTGRLMVEVRDTGVGMNDKFLKRVFMPFEQAKTSRTRERGGIGLGLAISLALSEAMGGELTASSAPGVGSVFRLSLPVASGALGKSEEPRMDVVEGGLETDVLHGRNILVAEDGRDNQRLIAFVLEREGANVTIVNNGALAVQRLQEEPAAYDLVLMDMQMPVLDGYSATRQIRDRGLDTPVIALTAHAMDGDRQRCLDAGCDEFLTKPIDRDKLVEVLVRFAQKSSSKPAAA